MRRQPAVAHGCHMRPALGIPSPQKAWFANLTLSTWPSCQKYLLVDLWAQQVSRLQPGACMWGLRCAS